LDDGLALVRDVGGLEDVVHGELDVVIDLDPDIEFGLEEVGSGSAAGSGDESVFADDAELTAQAGRGTELGCQIDPRGEDGAADVSVGVGGDVDGRRGCVLAHCAGSDTDWRSESMTAFQPAPTTTDLTT
jgi:hypothetical protein